MKRTNVLIATLIFTLSGGAARSEVVLDLSTATLTLDDRGGVVALTFADGSTWAGGGQPAFALRRDGKSIGPRALTRDADLLTVTFEDDSTARFAVSIEPGFALFRLKDLQAAGNVESLRLFRLPLPEGAQIRSTLNAATAGPNAAALMACELNVHAHTQSSAAVRGNRAGCSHQFEPVAEAKQGQTAARFTATADKAPGGWSVRGTVFRAPLDLTGCKAIRAWVHGDGQGQSLKFQLGDGAGGYRDAYIPIDFQGWKQVTIEGSPYDTLRYDRATLLNIYYNSLPAGKTVSCLIDQVEAVIERNGKEQVVLLEDFESRESPVWGPPRSTLNVETLARYGLEPAAFGLLACPDAEFFDLMPRFEVAAGLPSPRLDGEWAKRSEWIKQSYLFLTNFRESQFDEALSLARRGGFGMILLGQESWSRGTGHYEINRDRYPDGLDGLARTIRRFKDAGFRVGLHFLAASIYPPDPYLTPVPDPRLVKGATATLAADIDEKADTIPVIEPPEGFPAEDGGYRGEGTILQIGDELIAYGERSLTEPFGFTSCRRGHLGTKVTPHRKGEPVRHLVRAYGYHMYDLNSSLREEVAAHFGRVANTCDIDMVYFDGSERLPGDHWYANARLQRGFFDAIKRKDVLYQGSSYSHYSWHQLARTASADGHGDLKGYLDERSPVFLNYARNGMPLDIGWYYGYDPQAAPDMFEYVLGATIGYDASMSFQVSVDAAAKNPYTGVILDMISRYERLRRSGRVPEEMKARLRIDPALGGQKTPEERAKLLDKRRDYRLLGEEGREVFQRVFYTPWQDVVPGESTEATWRVEVPEGSRLGVQFLLPSGPWLAAGPSYRADDAIVLETFDDLAPYTSDPKDQDVREVSPGQGGSVFPGVTQRLTLEDGGKEGPTFAVYSAESSLARPEGWSVVTRTFDPPLDLSAHRGIGFWLRGDGQGGQFKLQLRDGKGAMDYYVPNDYEGWRYQQLLRPETDAIDYSQVRFLSFYYNGLPGRTTVTCAIDDVKALTRLDERSLTDPQVVVNGQPLGWTGTLTEGQSVFLWPGEPAALYGPLFAEPRLSSEATATIEVPPGTHEVRFGQAGDASGAARVRVTLQPAERHEIP